MEPLIDLLDWRTLAGVSALFGFAPRAVLRLVVLAWPPGDPRRQELLAELQAIDYWRRPIWVAEQLETALFDGLRLRVRGRRDGHVSTAPASTELAQPNKTDDWDDATFVSIFCS